MGTRPGQLFAAHGVIDRNKTERLRSGFDRFLFVIGLVLLVLSLSIISSAQDPAALSDTIRTGSNEQKRDALFQIKTLRTEQASRLAVPALSDPDEMVRATAVSAAVFLPPAEAAALLAPLLADKMPFVRKETALALGSVRDSSATAALISRLDREKDLEVKSSITIAFGNIGDVSAVETLNKLLGERPKEETEFIRRSAARSIGQIAQFAKTGNARAVTPQNFLPEQFKDGKGRDLTEEFPVFGASTARLSSVLQNNDESDDTRREAAFALGSIGSSSAINVLQTYQNSPDPYLSEISKEALLKIAK